ncbi:hypothetical protein L484_013620 [Morus notabilis]|uniref:Uncharacterized protein n=1 Tax=Morus notabilis TaxID=981085 RepID=W9R8P7_9ROSA|nr:hypothetical protein L484_013620 [Morus notabilis]
MEGVGARLGRSSRYGPATVFNGPVRKWKKKWVHVASPSSSSTPSSNSHHHHHHHPHLHNASSNGTNGSHLVLYKWTPLTQSQNAAITPTGPPPPPTTPPPLQRSLPGANSNTFRLTPHLGYLYYNAICCFKYYLQMIAVLEEQKDDSAEEEAAEKTMDEAKPIDADQSTKDENLDEKPDINDVPMEETQETNKVVRQDLNESTLDLSLGLNAHDGDNDTDSKADHRDCWSNE